MMNFLKYYSGLFLLLTCCSAAVVAQPCMQTDDLLAIPGTLTDHSKLPLGGGTFSVKEKPVAMKALITAENLSKKNFSLRGGYAKAWFHKDEASYYDAYLTSPYKFKIGFYQYVCVNGKKVNSDEYTADFSIIINPDFGKNYSFASDPGVDPFYVNRLQSGYLPIPVFRLLQMPAGFFESVNSGKGFTDNAPNNFTAHTDVYRNWFINKPGKPVLLPVTRKEFLENLIECYEREKIYHGKRLKEKIAEAEKYMAQYKQSGNKEMYKSHAENKQAAEKSLAELENAINTKRKLPDELLKKETTWLNETATVDPMMPVKFDINNVRNSMVFNGFSSGIKSEIICRYNPEIVSVIKTRPAKPLFI